MSIFNQPYAVTFQADILSDGATDGVVRGYYMNEDIAPDEKILVVEVVTEEDEVNELALVKTPNGWEPAILTEDYEPYFAPGEPLDKVKTMMNLADAVLTNKLHPCTNGDIFGMGQMFTHENLSNFKAGAQNLGLTDGPQVQAFLIANPIVEIAVGDERVMELMGLCHQYDEVQNAYDAGKALWEAQLSAYRSGDLISLHDQDTGTYDVFQGIYIGRTDNVFGKSEHIGVCPKGVYVYEDDWSNPINVAKELHAFEPVSDDSDELGLKDTVGLTASLGWVPEKELIHSAQSLELLAESISSLHDADVDMFQNIEMEG